ncbi:hypothetical protein ElyMa_003463600 [Elysia marginata]|uniref:Uncharacterized protein n=1 Tax=Elysia marginata TaxID=1093978 RepID=A0AAV4EBJ1_9GAST|nr:hypothetical protein ElyMa_003463600 [Elysia marginata]
MDFVLLNGPVAHRIYCFGTGMELSGKRISRCSQGLGPNDKRGYHDLASAGHIILTPTQPVGARTVLGCVLNPRPLGHGAKPLPTELSRPPALLWAWVIRKQQQDKPRLFQFRVEIVTTGHDIRILLAFRIDNPRWYQQFRGLASLSPEVSKTARLDSSLRVKK